MVDNIINGAWLYCRVPLGVDKCVLQPLHSNNWCDTIFKTVLLSLYAQLDLHEQFLMFLSAICHNDCIFNMYKSIQTLTN